jgi:hypothetical protein
MEKNIKEQLEKTARLIFDNYSGEGYKIEITSNELRDEVLRLIQCHINDQREMMINHEQYLHYYEGLYKMVEEK